jgi:hypothetical protein
LTQLNLQKKLEKIIKNSKGIKEFNDFKYCPDNPDLAVRECVEKIL